MAKLSLDEVLYRFRTIHGEKYDYSLITKDNYINTNNKVSIICRTCGSTFKQLPSVHLLGCGCRKCANERIRKSKKGKARKDMRHLIYGIGICDTQQSVNENGKPAISYNVWHDMLRRCYCKSFQEKEPTYKGCYVCEEWKLYSNFKQWFVSEKSGYKDGYNLDKDILFKGNKVYSPQTCCFVPREINTLLTNRKKHRGNYPIGVTKSSKTNKFEAAFFNNGKRIYLGTYDTPESAFISYKEAKEAHIKEVAEKYYNDGLITQCVYYALLRYKIEITD